MLIKVLNPVFSEVKSNEDAQILAGFLKYKASYWREGPFHKVQKEWNRPLIIKGRFLTGFIPRVEKYCNDRHIPIDKHVLPTPSTPNPFPPIEAKLPDWLESDQVEALQAISHHHRGVIHHPTGSGKTEIFLIFLTLHPTWKGLIIVNTQDLIIQTAQRAQKYFKPEEIGVMGAGMMSPARITIATIQTLSNLDLSDFPIDVVVVDEAHHISKFSPPFTKDKGGSYARVLSSILAPIRLGFTGTLPYTDEAKMALEGYIGPVISTKKTQEIERLAKIKIKLRMLPVTQTAKDSKTYKDVYQLGVVFNSRRSRQVMMDTMGLVLEHRTVLILVTQINHGHNILETAKRMYPDLRIQFVWGSVPGQDRSIIKKLFNEGKIDVVIANAVWKEGVDIPTLGAIVNAAGGKSEIMTIQSLGRGLRTVPGIKDDVILRDYFDPSHRYLSEHFIYRLITYFDEGWIENL